MKKIYTINILLVLIFCCACNKSLTAQQSLLVNLGSNACSNPDSAIFSIIGNPLGASSLLTNCDLTQQVPDYHNILIAYNPKDNKIYLMDGRYSNGSAIWVVDVGLPNSIACPSLSPFPDFFPAYKSNNFEFDNSGRLWSVRDYSLANSNCQIDQYDILTGNIISNKTLQFPPSNAPTDIGNGDICLLPNGRLFATFGRSPSRLYEITNYNGGSGNAIATYLQTLPHSCFGLAFLNGKLEVTGTNEVDACYYFEYNISDNILGPYTAFQNGQSPIDNTSISPIIGATKRLSAATKLTPTSAQLVYEIYVQNMGNVILNNVNVTEDLGKLFGAANISNVSTQFVPGFNTSGFTLNSAYNGTTQTQLLNTNQSLVDQTSSATDYIFKIQVAFTATNIIPDFIYYNSAIATGDIGSASNLINVSDSSNNGYSDVVDPNKNGIANEDGENIPTPFNLNILPVKFISNSAISKTNEVVVEWKVATPTINAQKFIIEFSESGTTWTKAGEVAITNASQSNYQFEYAANEKGFYRIKEIDKDGSVTYSTIMKVNNSNKNKTFDIYPNPANNFIQITQYNNSDKTDVELYDAIGKKILSQPILNGTTKINTTTLSRGMYIVKMMSNGNIETQRVLVTH